MEICEIESVIVGEMIERVIIAIASIEPEAFGGVLRLEFAEEAAVGVEELAVQAHGCLHADPVSLFFLYHLI